MTYFFEDFTEGSYRELIKLAKANYQFINYSEYNTPPKKAILWRHDIDCSVHRAFRMAQIEYEEGVQSTYFILIHSLFYNIFEKENTNLIFKIKDLGHKLGLHFDPEFYASTLNTSNYFLEELIFEKEILEKTFKTKIEAFSLHNPDVSNWLRIDDNEIGNMINTYSKYLRNNYSYCSDSNGYWRFRRLRDVLEAAQDEKLQVLTHPGWWTPEPMSPRDRISRCINGRAAKQHQLYDELLQKAGRKNIKSEDAKV